MRREFCNPALTQEPPPEDEGLRDAHDHVMPAEADKTKDITPPKPSKSSVWDAPPESPPPTPPDQKKGKRW
jgi:hypothetical protein